MEGDTFVKTSDFYYDLPQELIAQTPLEVRDTSRLLIYQRDKKSITDGVFTDILQYIQPNDILVRNTTKVIPARLFATRKETNGNMEFLLLKRINDTDWECLARPGKRAKPGLTFYINEELSAIVLESLHEGRKVIRFLYDGIFEEVLDRAGQMPLPPYITEKLSDKTRYQTVYAQQDGSAAAPTAGLHFTTELLQKIQAQGTQIADVLLHVGLGTFRPVSMENVEDHVMHSEYFEVSQEAADKINQARQNGGRIIAVGTTSCRTLESATNNNGIVQAKSGWTNIFITPGYRFRSVDALITNFHLPESTLLMLVSALSTREEMLRVYQYAVKERYRFFSFGDAMLLV